MGERRVHTEMIWFSLAIFSLLGAAARCSEGSDPASMPKPLAELVRMSTVGEGGTESGSWRSSRAAASVLGGCFGVDEATAGERGC